MSTVSAPPFPRGTTWSTWRWAVAPQIPPPARGHWHLPWSRFTTSRFTRAGTQALRLACFSRRASSAAVSTCSSVAPGWTWDCPAFAIRSSVRNSRETVMWSRLSVAVIGWMAVRPASVLGAQSSPR
ncbi:MAG: hypothetical protein WB493_08565 [Anaeromyxobacteraceae bacterium]